MMPKQRGQLPDGVRGTPIRKIGYHGWKTWELSFENAYAETMIGAEGQGFKVAMGDLDTARVHTAARAIGLARGALEDATAYAKQRVQFGRPIAQNQAIRFRIADMATQVAAARSLMFQVCTEVDAGRTSPVSASMVKLFASEMAEKVTSDALQIHGGSGYTTDFPVERYWRDTRLTKPEAGLRPWSTFVVNAAAGGLDLQQSATGLGGQAEATVAVGSGAVHTSSLAAQANRFDPPSSACQVRRSGRLPPRGGRRAVVHGPVDPRHGRRRRVRGAAGHRRAARQRWRRLLQQSGRRRGRPWQPRPGQHRFQLRLGRARGHADQPGRRGSHRQLRRPRRRPPATVRGQPPTVSGQGPRSAHTTWTRPNRSEPAHVGAAFRCCGIASATRHHLAGAPAHHTPTQAHSGSIRPGGAAPTPPGDTGCRNRRAGWAPVFSARRGEAVVPGIGHGRRYGENDGLGSARPPGRPVLDPPGGAWRVAW